MKGGVKKKKKGICPIPDFKFEPAPLRAGLTLPGASCCLVLRFSGISQQRVERLRMAVAAMCAASASWE